VKEAAQTLLQAFLISAGVALSCFWLIVGAAWRHDDEPPTSDRAFLLGFLLLSTAWLVLFWLLYLSLPGVGTTSTGPR